MKILLAGYDTPGALERYSAKALERLGHPVTFFDVYREFARFCRFGHVPVLSELEQGLWRRRVNRRLLEAARSTRPDLLLVFKGIEFNSATFERIRINLPGLRLVNWNPDSPFDRSASNTSPELVASIPCYDVYFIWDRDLFTHLSEAGAQRVAYLPFGYDPDVHRPVSLPAGSDARYTSQVCFVGGYTPARASLLEGLAHHDLEIWGPNWNHLPGESPLHGCLQGGWTHGLEMSKIFCRADIVLNFIRPQNGQAHNMRTFEALATGSFMLSTRTRDQAAWFPDGEAAAYFEDISELATKVEYYLSHADERQQIASKGYRIVTQGEHTYLDRMQELIAVVESL